MHGQRLQGGCTLLPTIRQVRRNRDGSATLTSRCFLTDPSLKERRQTALRRVIHANYKRRQNPKFTAAGLNNSI